MTKFYLHKPDEPMVDMTAIGARIPFMSKLLRDKTLATATIETYTNRLKAWEKFKVDFNKMPPYSAAMVDEHLELQLEDEKTQLLHATSPIMQHEVLMGNWEKNYGAHINYKILRRKWKRVMKTQETTNAVILNTNTLRRLNKPELRLAMFMLQTGMRRSSVLSIRKCDKLRLVTQPGWKVIVPFDKVRNKAWRKCFVTCCCSGKELPDCYCLPHTLGMPKFPVPPRLLSRTCGKLGLTSHSFRRTLSCMVRRAQEIGVAPQFKDPEAKTVIGWSDNSPMLNHYSQADWKKISLLEMPNIKFFLKNLALTKKLILGQSTFEEL